jgi:hypothetical protein
MARISVFSRAHRALRELPRFRFLQNETELAAYRQEYDSVVIGEPIGIYSNPVPTQPETILVAERGLVTIRGGDMQSIPFAELGGIQGPHTKADASRISLTLRSGLVVNLEIHGRDGKFQDVFSFVRFLDRVMEDQSRQHA